MEKRCVSSDPSVPSDPPILVPGHLPLYFDGACEPNPEGLATYGWVLLNPDGEVVAEGSGVVGRGAGMTNNVAEYHGLGHGLRWLADHPEYRPERLLVRGDSKLVVHQVAGQWACNVDHLRRLRDRCRELMAQVGCEVEFGWVPREENAYADNLSRLAWEKETGRRLPERRRKAVR